MEKEYKWASFLKVAAPNYYVEGSPFEYQSRYHLTWSHRWYHCHQVTAQLQLIIIIIIHQIQYCTVHETGKIELDNIQMQAPVMHYLEQPMMQALPFSF